VTAVKVVTQIEDIPSQIRKTVESHDLPPSLVKAIVRVESAGEPWAMRYERAYRWLWDNEKKRPYRGDPDLITPFIGSSAQTELVGQKTSWGLMQIMGAVAREYGFRDPFLSSLCEPKHGLEYGCIHLVRLRDRFFSEHGWHGVAAAYNAGSPRYKAGNFINQPYVDKIAAKGGFDDV
jgi:soluble lytic murein transglycosylase-like protein